MHAKSVSPTPFRGAALVGLLLTGLLWITAGCLFTDSGSSGSVPRNAIVVDVVAHTAVVGWLEQSADTFNRQNAKSADGRSVHVVVRIGEAGQTAAALRDGSPLPALWVPDDAVWSSVADAGAWECVPLAESPLVIAMWQEAAEALGWPGRSLGWLDVGSLAADPGAWQYYTGGQFGDSLHLGHTHPGLSGSGSSTLLALVHAAENKPAERVTVADIERPIVQASVGAFEAAVAWFSSDTRTLAETMVARGPGYLGAAVLYENLVLTVGGGQLVSIIPFEGTFVATNPGCVAESADPETAAAARLFRDWLLTTPGQELAQQAGLRPVGTPPAPGEVRYPAPTADTLYAVQALWQAARKPLHLVMLLDISGSMRGDKMDGMRRSAEQFVSQMNDADRLTLVVFSTFATTIAEFVPVDSQRQALSDLVRALEARGDTALYDAIGLGAETIARYASPEYANALVVLTDGQDTSSNQYGLNQELYRLAAANGTTVFTIAYGRDADVRVMEQLALGANGRFFLGNEAGIGQIYEEMSAAFGGSAGIGR